MAKTINNSITHGVSGKFGEQIVFRQVNGQTLMCKSPISRGKTSAKQEQQQEKFKKASQYAKRALEDPVLSAGYALEAKRRKGQSAYNVAVADYLISPTIDKVDVSAYTGNVGEKIKIQAYDDYKVEAVKVYIHTSSSLVEEGEAILQGIEWIYTIQTENTNLSGSKITVKVIDTAGNESEQEVVV
ncbi:hypothetical protein ACFFUE_04340 [Bergeyella porcorum]|uniref:hypothetical protein n=1 Tax=Bergeyella porcorum TaxID=1735111 RepID=UPI0035EAE2D6